MTSVGLLLSAGVAAGATGPPRLQRLAAAQTQLLLKHLNAPLGDQAASPSRCNQGQDEEGTRGTFLLPTRSFGSGNRTFNCHVETGAVLVDLGGAIATEDDRFGRTDEFASSWTTAHGDVLAFTKANLERICDDILPRLPDFGIAAPAPATVDGKPISGATAVSTVPFTSRIRPTTGTELGSLYRDSVDLGHPGTLATTYCGWKARVPLKEGRHVITVALADNTVFTYNIKVDD